VDSRDSHRLLISPAVPQVQRAAELPYESASTVLQFVNKSLSGVDTKMDCAQGGFRRSSQHWLDHHCSCAVKAAAGVAQPRILRGLLLRRVSTRAKRAKNLVAVPISLKPQAKRPRRHCSGKHLQIRVDSDGVLSVTLGTLLNGNRGEGLRISATAGGR
jgi:hypothetical protein